jgi:thiamine biosynthesis lipoprotein
MQLHRYFPYLAAGALPFLALGTPATAAEPEPVRMATTAFGASAEVEVRGLPRPAAEEALRAALEEIFEIGRLADPDAGELPGGFGALNAAAGRESRPIDERMAELLTAGLQICFWSHGAHGPLGGEIYRLWRNPGEERRIPEPTDLRWAVVRADCSRLELAGDEKIAAVLGEGTRVDPVWMARGFALDRAARVLEEHGVENAWLEIGPVVRAMGGGSEGEGWPIALPPAPGDERPLDELWLRDQALAVVTREPAARDAAHRESPPELIDQRTGVPPRGVVTVVAVTERAMDAEALAATLFIMGLHEGQMRLGSLRPRPSVYWLLGEGIGDPLESTYNWSELRRRR